MTPADWERASAIYLPLVVAAIARLLTGRKPKQFAACLLSILWTIPTLLALQIINTHAVWWTFQEGSAISLHGIPPELFVGWVLLWGLVPQLALQRLGIVWSAVVMIAVDCILMPTCTAAISLHRNWLIGEIVGVALVLLPALSIGQWTRSNTNLGRRAAIQVGTAGLLFLFLIPETIFALRPGLGWSPLLNSPSWARQIELQILFIFAIPGLGAVLEFAERGWGTPIPYDPPERLVTSGIYRYCANPMQMSCGLVMFAYAGLLRSGWMAVAAGISIVYGAGIAEWDEAEDLGLRFGPQWKSYRASVRSWRIRWTPHHVGQPAIVYIARGCGPCSQVRSWLAARNPKGLQIMDAESLPANSIRRMRYDPQDGSVPVDGVRAMGRALEHLHLGWTLCGTALRLPILWQIIQLFMDASGLGPREIRSSEFEARSSL